MNYNIDVNEAMTIKLDYALPEYPDFAEGVRRAPKREAKLSRADKELAVKNALRHRCRWNQDELNRLAEQCALADWQIKKGICTERTAVDQLIDQLTIG